MLRSTLIILLLAFSAAASAEGFNYNYLSVGYGNTDFDGLNADGDGFVFGGSFAINDSLHAFAGFEDAHLCSCGKRHQDCNVWSPVVQYISENPSSDLLMRYKKVIESVEEH